MYKQIIRIQIIKYYYAPTCSKSIKINTISSKEAFEPGQESKIIRVSRNSRTHNSYIKHLNKEKQNFSIYYRNNLKPSI